MFVYDRFKDNDDEETTFFPGDIGERKANANTISLRDDGLGQYKIPPLEAKKEERSNVSFQEKKDIACRTCLI